MNRDQALLDALLTQRNDALNQWANAVADLAVANERMKALEAELKETRPVERSKE